MRRTIDQIRKTLGHFGVSDPGDIADFLRLNSSPTAAELEKLLKGLSLRVSPSITPRFLAESLLSAINSLDPLTMKWRTAYGECPHLNAIKRGAKDAGKYHRVVFAMLQGIFDGCLVNGRIEQEVNTGIHRVDVMFDNAATSGFFGQVRSRLSMNADYVPIECKNYTDDVGSPEYDQLSGRLNNSDRQVGLMVVREISDKKKSFEHVKAKWAKGELIIVLSDAEISDMYDARFGGHVASVDQLLWSKVRSLQLNSEM